MIIKRSRAKQTRTSIGVSLGLHAALLLLLAVGVTAQSQLDDDLVEISYIEARYGKEVAQKVAIRSPVPGSGPGGVSSRSAHKETPKSETKKAAKPTRVTPPRPERPKPTQLADAEFDLAAVRPVDAPDKLGARKQLETRDLVKAMALDTSNPMKTANLSDAVSAQIPVTSSISSNFAPEKSSLISRAGGAVLDDVPFKTSDTGGSMALVLPDEDATSRAAIGGGGLLASAGQFAPEGAGSLVESDGPGSGAIMDAAALAPAPGGGSSESRGRRTILDYGSGNGGPGGGGGGALMEKAPPAAGSVLEEVRRDKQASDEQLVDRSISANGKGVSFMLAGPISDREIVRAITPPYPADAKANGWEGVVAIHFTVLAAAA